MMSIFPPTMPAAQPASQQQGWPKDRQMNDEQIARYKRASAYAKERHQEWTPRTELLALHLWLFAEQELNRK